MAKLTEPIEESIRSIVLMILQDGFADPQKIKDEEKHIRYQYDELSPNDRGFIFYTNDAGDRLLVLEGSTSTTYCGGTFPHVVFKLDQESVDFVSQCRKYEKRKASGDNLDENGEPLDDDGYPMSSPDPFSILQDEWDAIRELIDEEYHESLEQKLVEFKKLTLEGNAQ